MNQTFTCFWVSLNSGSDTPILLSETEAIEASYKDPSAFFMSEDQRTGWCTAKDLNFPPPPPNYKIESNKIKKHNLEDIAIIQDLFSRTTTKEDIEVFFPIPENMLNRYEKHWDWKNISENPNIEWNESLISDHLGYLSFGEDPKWFDEEELRKGYTSLEDIPISKRKMSGNKGLPWDNSLISKFKYKWEWYYLSANEFIPWNESLIDSFIDKWHWNIIIDNSSIQWSPHLLEKYSDYINWSKLSEKPHLPWSEHLIDRFIDKWNWCGLSGNTALPWKFSFFERYLDKWNFYRGRDSYCYWGKSLSENKNLPWSIELIEEYKNKWSWHDLSGNSGLPLSLEFIIKYEDRWDWEKLSGNRGAFWSSELIERYEDRWDWERICQNTSIPWSKSLIDKYINKINLDEIFFYCGYNKKFKWTIDLIDKYLDQLSFSTMDLSLNIPWSESLIDKYSDKWNWDYLCENEAINWDRHLLTKFSDKIIWQRLIKNPRLKYLFDIIIKSDVMKVFANKFEGNSLVNDDLNVKSSFDEYKDSTKLVKFPEGWPESENENYKIHIDNNFYVFTIKRSNYSAWQTYITNKSSNNFTVSTQSYFTRRNKAPSACGLLFNVKNNYEFNYIMISDHGYYKCGYRENDRPNDIIDWQYSPYIKVGQINLLHLFVQQNEIKFYANGYLLNTITLPSIGTGSVGLIAENSVQNHAEVKFQNFKISPSEEEIPFIKNPGNQSFFFGRESFEIDREGDFILYENSVVKDTLTGLEWCKAPEVPLSLDQAIGWAEDLWLNGGGWRLPKDEELLDICRRCYGWSKGFNLPHFLIHANFGIWADPYSESGANVVFCQSVSSGHGGRTGNYRTFVVRNPD